MTPLHDDKQQEDQFNLVRFIVAQKSDFTIALSELKNGHKKTHWMWYIFPQIAGLGFSETARLYAIHSREEARAYLDHPVLGARLRECSEALMGVDGKSATAIMGSPDDMKLKSSMTLFAQVAEPGSVFSRVLEKYYGGKQDEKTLELL